MDFDHDGKTDIIAGGYMGLPFFIEGRARSWKEPVILKDKEKTHLETGEYADPDTKEGTEGMQPYEGKARRAYSALPFDWDNDGDYDLIRGTSSGQLFLRLNEGTPKKASFAETTKFLDLEIPGAYAMPVAADWNGDGLTDLISGSKDGAVYWFKNTGKIGEPKFEDPEQLVKNSEAEDLGRGTHAQVEVCDWDNDGKLDLLVGDRNWKSSEITGSSPSMHGYVWFYQRLN